MKDPLLEEEPTIDVGGVLPDLAATAGGPVILAGRYVLLGLLGSGGMGTVYRARDTELGELIAVKVLRRELLASPQVVARFRREVRLARRVTHRNVARTFDIGEHGGERFITMEYVEGESLADRLARRGRLPLAEALDLAGCIAAGLSAAHAAGVVHRDLKPENVLLTQAGRVVLTDFGLARTFEEEESDTVVDGGVELLGTPVYMAPEQVEGAVDVDARADIYALGAMLYEMTTGERPWGGDTAWAVASARLSAPPPDPRFIAPELPEALSAVLARAMARSRDDRHASAEDLAAELAPIAIPSAPASFRGTRQPLASLPDVHVEVGTKVVAVLPFVWTAPDDEPFARGIMTELVDALTSVEGLRVRGPASTRSLGGTTRDVRALGRELGVQAVIDGVVRRAGPRLVILARLTAVVDGFQLWATKVEREIGDFFGLVFELASGLLAALTARARVAAAPALRDPRMVEPYLRARMLLAEAPEQAARAAAQALLAGEDGLWLSVAALAAELRALHVSEPAATALRDEALSTGERGVAVAPQIAAPWGVVARRRFARGAYVDAARALKSALSLAPGAAEAQALYGAMLALAGRPRQGLTFLEASAALEPSLPGARLDALRVRALLGDWPAVEKALARPSGDPRRDLALVRLALWHPDPAARHVLARGPSVSAEARALLRAPPGATVGQDALALAQRDVAGEGEGGEAHEVIDRLQRAAEIFALSGDDAAALAAIGRALAAGLVDVTWLERCPVLLPLSRDLAAAHAEVSARAERVRVALRTPPAR